MIMRFTRMVLTCMRVHMYDRSVEELRQHTSSKSFQLRLCPVVYLNTINILAMPLNSSIELHDGLLWLN